MNYKLRAITYAVTYAVTTKITSFMVPTTLLGQNRVILPKTVVFLFLQGWGGKGGLLATFVGPPLAAFR